MPAVKKPVFTQFSSLCQVIYQGEQEFIAFSYLDSVEDDRFVEQLERLELLGLTSTDGEPSDSKDVTFEICEVHGARRWWRGVWTLEDVKHFAGAGGVDAQVKIIADTVNAFKEGNISVTGATPATDESQTQSTSATTQESQVESQSHHVGPILRIDLGGEAAVRIPLTSIPDSQAAGRATLMLTAVANVISSTHNGVLSSEDGALGGRRRSTTPANSKTVLKMQEETKSLKDQITYLSSELKKHDKEELAPPPPKPHGRSLANPSRKARVIKDYGFDDEDEEEAVEKKPTKKRKKVTLE